MSTSQAMALMMAAASALLVAAAWNRAAVEDALGLADGPDESGNTGADWLDELAAGLATVRDAVMPSPVASMRTSAAGLAHLQAFEGLRLVRYRLGDGGYTIGWGRFYPDGGPPAPEAITRETADAWFVQDVAERGERWVHAYVTAPQTQAQFDALVSMAYNLKPASFKAIADAVNAGQGPEAAALRFVRAGTHLEAGLRRRRAAELRLYFEGVYT